MVIVSVWLSSATVATSFMLSLGPVTHTPEQHVFSAPIKASVEAAHDAAQSAAAASLGSLEFAAKTCKVLPKLVSCILTVASPMKNRTFTLSSFRTQLIDMEGDIFTRASNAMTLLLKRDQKSTFQVEFPVTKNVAFPARVKLVGLVSDGSFETSFNVR